jgi:SAM-dependent methyltransferase
MTDKRTLPSIDVVIPVSRMWYLPYLENSLRSLRAQDYPRELVGITISFVVEDAEEDIGELCDLCREHDATIVFTHPEDPAFNISKAYNAGARAGSREAIACFDADIVFSPQTLSFAASVLKQGKLAIVPVVYKAETAHDEYFQKVVPSLSTKEWIKHTKGMGCRRDANGNIVIPRNVYEHLHGYDERFYGWGAADHDFFVRANHFQGAVHMMDTECPKSMHQQHKARADVESDNTKRNRHLLATSKTKVRNFEWWGRMPVDPVLPPLQIEQKPEQAAPAPALAEKPKPEPEQRKAVVPYNRHLAGVPAQHALATYDVIESIMQTHPHISRIIELGTADGALSMYLGLWNKRLGIPVYTIDNRPAAMNRKRMPQTFRELGVQFVLMNALSKQGLAAVRTMLEGAAVYLICDNGNKKAEFNTLVPHLLPGSVVSIHDWGTEVLPSQVEHTVKDYTLRPFRPGQWEKDNLKMATWTVPGEPMKGEKAPALVFGQDWPPKGNGWHRRAVGDGWNQMGSAQLRLLKSRGLKPEHFLLEVGCGCLRFGTKAIAYLERGHYVGIEADESLLDAGRNIELPAAEGCKGKNPYFILSNDFDMSGLQGSVRFDYAMAQSVFTHLHITGVELCIKRVMERLKPGGIFCASYNDAPKGWFQFGFPYPKMCHYPFSMFEDMAFRYGATVENLGDWGIPQNKRGEQLMLVFTKK